MFDDDRLLQALRDKANKAEAKLEALNELLDDIDDMSPNAALLVLADHLERRKHEADVAIEELLERVQRKLPGWAATSR